MCVSIPCLDSQPDIQTRFLAILPRLVLHAEISFRHLECQQRRDDAVAEAVALAWKWFLALTRKGKVVENFVSALARYAVRAVKTGRRLCRQCSKDVLSPVAQRRRGFQVESLSGPSRVSFELLYSTPRGQERLDALEERLRDNTITPPPEQAIFRIDFPSWRRTRTERDRRLMDELMMGERTKDVARRFGLSPARVSQLRREFHADWERFCGDSSDEALPPEAGAA